MKDPIETKSQFQICEQYFKRIEGKIDDYFTIVEQRNLDQQKKNAIFFREIFGGKDCRGLRSKLELHKYAILLVGVLAIGKTALYFWG